MKRLIPLASYWLLAHLTHVDAATLEWITQYGTENHEYSRSVSADRLGNVFISGYTTSVRGGPVPFVNAFVSKFDDQGSLLWTKQLDSSSEEESYSVSADGLGNVYISGRTDGDLGAVNAGGKDSFLSKYDGAGNLLWTKQLGTRSDDESYGVRADALGNVYITGWTGDLLGGSQFGSWDAYLSKFDGMGNLTWTQQIGSLSGDYSQSVSTDGLGNVYISGRTFGDLDGPSAGFVDAFLSQYDTEGNLKWTRQLGAEGEDNSVGVSADSLGNIFITGRTDGDLAGPNLGHYDVHVSKFDAVGNLVWKRQLGTASEDQSYGVSADGLGNVYVTGFTRGDLDGNNAGFQDAFVSKYDADGNLLWTEQLGSDQSDASYGVSVDGRGNLYISGFTGGQLGGAIAGGVDVFLAKFSDPVPEPSSAMITALLFAFFSLSTCYPR